MTTFTEDFSISPTDPREPKSFSGERLAGLAGRGWKKVEKCENITNDDSLPAEAQDTHLYELVTKSRAQGPLFSEKGSWLIDQLSERTRRIVSAMHEDTQVSPGEMGTTENIIDSPRFRNTLFRAVGLVTDWSTLGTLRRLEDLPASDEHKVDETLEAVTQELNETIGEIYDYSRPRDKRFLLFEALLGSEREGFVRLGLMMVRESLWGRYRDHFWRISNNTAFSESLRTDARGRLSLVSERVLQSTSSALDN